MHDRSGLPVFDDSSDPIFGRREEHVHLLQRLQRRFRLLEPEMHAHLAEHSGRGTQRFAKRRDVA